LLHLWGVAEQANARLLLKQRFVDVQAVAKVALHLPTVPSLEDLRQHIEFLGGMQGDTEGYENTPEYLLSHPMDAAAIRWIYHVLVSSM
jgi:hypothetical protein